jgi:hypothetical protein
MNTLPQPQRSPRAVRVRPAEYTPAVLRIEDGSCTQATLELYSVTGGLLSLQKPLDRGSRARVLFLTQTGPVLGMAEMLRPLSWREQPFRFLTLHEEDERKLREATQPVVEPAVEGMPPQVETAAATVPNTPALDAEEPWIQKYRTAIYDTPPPKRFFGKLFAGLTGGTLGLGAIVYALQHLLR